MKMDTRDDFDDLNLIDQFIPLEQLEYSLSPFNPTLSTLNTKNGASEMNVLRNDSLNDLNNQSGYTDSNESSLSNSSVNQPVKATRYPEPYAIMIVKAILSREDNVMQLKDIYNYFMTNYEIFSMEPDSTKWKNSIRHNLSRHKYFVKTSEKNAQGHYWSIDADYLKYFKQGIYECKTLVKQAKLKRQGISKKPNKRMQTGKSGKENNVSSSPQTNHLMHQSIYNDSAYMSNNEANDTSFNNYLSSSIYYI